MKYLKSSMDRFIDDFVSREQEMEKDLKSSMDRFIVLLICSLTTIQKI